MSMSDEICRDFEKGDCRRGERCKFFHPRLIICRDFQNKKCDRNNCRYLHVTREDETKYNNSGIIPEDLDEAEARQKRIMTPSGNSAGVQNVDGMYGKRRRDSQGFYPTGGMTETPSLVIQENELLRQKVTELQRQVIELRQMNDTLYDQNTKFRNQLSGGTSNIAPTSMTGYNSASSNGMVGTNPTYYGYSAIGR